MARLTAYANVEDLVRTISQEEGKPLTESRGEVSRMPDLLCLRRMYRSVEQGNVVQAISV